MILEKPEQVICVECNLSEFKEHTLYMESANGYVCCDCLHIGVMHVCQICSNEVKHVTKINELWICDNCDDADCCNDDCELTYYAPEHEELPF